MPKPEWWNLPNQITLSRIALAFVLFILLSLQLADASLFPDAATAHWVSAALFTLCVSTDWLDGMIARKRNLVTTFGRIADPFADKLLVLGTLIFMIPITELIAPWFVVVLLAREFLVSGLRSYLESQGIPFGARWGGKIKMVLQSVLIPFIFVVEALEFAPDEGAAWQIMAQVLIYATLAATIISLIDYLKVAARATPRESSS